MASNRTPLKKVPIHLQSAQSRLLIKGGKIVNDDFSFYADIYVEDGIIKQIGSNLVIPGGARTIEAKGKLIIPGGIDSATHFCSPVSSIQSADDFYSGTKAALSGATTTIVECVQAEEDQSLVDAYNRWRNAAEDKTCCDYVLKVALTSWNEKTAQEMEILVKEKGVNMFHLPLDTSCWADSDLYNVMKKCKELRVILTVQPNNVYITKEKIKEILALGIYGPEGYLLSHPEEVEAEAAYRVICIASLVNLPIIITNITSQLTADVVSESRRKGSVVYGEVMTAATVLNGDSYFLTSWKQAASFVVSPPLRQDCSTPHHLLHLLSNDDLQMTSSNHCSYDISQKAIGKDDFSKIPPGANGVQERMSLLWQYGVVVGKIDVNKFVAITSSNAAKLLNLYPKKGRIAIGSDADIVIWDADLTRTISTATQNHKAEINIFEGLTCSAYPTHIILGGSVILDEDGLRVTQGYGQFIPVNTNCELAYTRLLERDKVNKKEKSTDCDSALIPLLCVHG